MRVVSGIYKGRTIGAPEGRGTRPTTDRVRESLFSALYSRLGGFEGCNVLDAFAGSGALGIEALSRGASHATFVERDRKAAQNIERNLCSLGVGKGEYSLRNADVFKSVTQFRGDPFDVVFLDPPYAMPPSEVGQLVVGLHEAGMLGEGALVCYEHDAKTDITGLSDLLSDRCADVSSKKYGKSVISIFTMK